MTQGVLDISALILIDIDIALLGRNKQGCNLCKK